MGLAESSHCARAFSSFSAQASHWGSFSCFGAWVIGTWASAAAEQGLISCGLWALQLTGSVVVVHRLSCSEARGIFQDKGWNPCSLHWQVDSYPLYPQGSPCGGSSPFPPLPPSERWNLLSWIMHIWAAFLLRSKRLLNSWKQFRLLCGIRKSEELWTNWGEKGWGQRSSHPQVLDFSLAAPRHRTTELPLVPGEHPVNRHQDIPGIFCFISLWRLITYFCLLAWFLKMFYCGPCYICKMRQKLLTVCWLK